MQKAWAEERKYSTGIPLCQKGMGRKEETPNGNLSMSKIYGQERGNGIRWKVGEERQQ